MNNDKNKIERKIKETFTATKKYLDNKTGFNLSNIDKITEHIYVSNTTNILSKSNNVDTLLFLLDEKINKDLGELNKMQDKNIYNIPFHKNTFDDICAKTFKIISACVSNENKILIVSRNGVEEPFMVLINYFLTRYYLLYKYRDIKKNMEVLSFDNFYVKIICEFIKEKRSCLNINDKVLQNLIFLEADFKNDIYGILKKEIDEYEESLITENQDSLITRNQELLFSKSLSESDEDIEHIDITNIDEDTQYNTISFVLEQPTDNKTSTNSNNLISMNDDELENIMEEKLLRND